MTDKTKTPESKGLVLVFNANFHMIAITPSLKKAASVTGSYYPSVRMATNGKLKTANNLYFRLVPNDVTIGLSDLNRLTLQEFDKLCGIEREYCNPTLVNRRQKRFNKTV